MISVGAGGRLILDVSMSGTAGVVIDGGGVLEIAQNFSNAATFASGGVGTLQLDGPALFSGVIAGLASGDTIDFSNNIITAAAVAGDTLSVTIAGGQVENLTLAGPCLGDLVQTQLDGHGGTKVVVTDVPLPLPIHGRMV